MLKNRGITLIALVITIIILLILAGISIATLTGENGLLTKANTAKTETTKKSAEEKVKVAVAGSFGENGGIDLNDLNDNLRQVEGLIDILYNDTSIFADNKIEKLPIDVVVDGYIIEIDEKGKVTRKVPNPQVTHTISPDKQVQEGEKITITIKATIKEGTITKIIKPDKTAVENTTTITYEVIENGEYTFIVEGSEGGSTTYIVKITNGKDVETFSNIYTTTAEYADEDGNIAKIPKGFAVGVSSTISPINTIKNGLVITDKIDENNHSIGNEFVWIPVGTVYTNTKKTESKSITLGRYDFATNGTPSTYVNSKYVENSSYGNAKPKSLSSFMTSVSNNHGYYIGRYEAGVINYNAEIETSNSSHRVTWTGYSGNNIQLVCRKAQQVWNLVTQNKASQLSQNMYASGASVTSDLMNSYALDTALVYIQEFSGDSDYAIQTGKHQTALAKTGMAKGAGTDKDVRCNIYDIAGNCVEWSTEAYTNTDWPCVHRGGTFNSDNNWPGKRYGSSVVRYNASSGLSFRPLLYLI